MAVNKSGNFLVIAPQGLGDALQATPMLKRLRGAEPTARLTVVVTRAAPASLFRSFSSVVDEVIELPFWERGMSSFLVALLRHCRKRQYDAAFLTYPAARMEYALLLASFRARRRFSHRYGSWHFFDAFVSRELVQSGNESNALRNMALLDAAGIGGDASGREVVPDHWTSRRARRDIVAIHPGSIDHDGFALKRWPASRFGELADALLAEGHAVAVVSGPDERDLARELARSRHIPLIEGPLHEVARQLSDVSCVVANDSGVAHLSAASGTPTIVLFGPTPVTSAPLADNVIAVRPTSCPPCFRPATGIPPCHKATHQQCLSVDLTVEHALDAVRRAMTPRSIRNDR